MHRAEARPGTVGEEVRLQCMICALFSQHHNLNLPLMYSEWWHFQIMLILKSIASVLTPAVLKDLASDCLDLFNCIYNYNMHTQYTVNAQIIHKMRLWSWLRLSESRHIHFCIRLKCISSDHLWLGFASLAHLFFFWWGNWAVLNGALFGTSRWSFVHNTLYFST